MAFQKTMAMNPAEAFGPGGPGANLGAPPGGGFGAAPGSSPGGGFGPPGGAPGGFGAPGAGAPPAGGFGAPPSGGAAGFGAPPPGGGAPGAAQDAQKKKILKFVGFGCGALLLLSCCLWGGSYAYVSFIASSGDDDVEDVVATASDSDDDTDEGGGSGDACTRAAECCEAYIETMGAAAAGMSVESTCAGYRSIGAAGAEGCQQAIDGYRSTLTAMSKSIPNACK